MDQISTEASRDDRNDTSVHPTLKLTKPPRLVHGTVVSILSLQARPWRECPRHDQGNTRKMLWKKPVPPHHSGCKSGEAAERAFGGAVISFHTFSTRSNRNLIRDGFTS